MIKSHTPAGNAGQGSKPQGKLSARLYIVIAALGSSLCPLAIGLSNSRSNPALALILFSFGTIIIMFVLLAIYAISVGRNKVSEMIEFLGEEIRFLRIFFLRKKKDNLRNDPSDDRRSTPPKNKKEKPLKEGENDPSIDREINSNEDINIFRRIWNKYALLWVIIGGLDYLFFAWSINYLDVVSVSIIAELWIVLFVILSYFTKKESEDNGQETQDNLQLNPSIWVLFMFALFGVFYVTLSHNSINFSLNINGLILVIAFIVLGAIKVERILYWADKTKKKWAEEKSGQEIPAMPLANRRASKASVVYDWALNEYREAYRKAEEASKAYQEVRRAANKVLEVKDALEAWRRTSRNVKESKRAVGRASWEVEKILKEAEADIEAEKVAREAAEAYRKVREEAQRTYETYLQALKEAGGTYRQALEEAGGEAYKAAVRARRVARRASREKEKIFEEAWKAYQDAQKADRRAENEHERAQKAYKADAKNFKPLLIFVFLGIIITNFATLLLVIIGKIALMSQGVAWNLTFAADPTGLLVDETGWLIRWLICIAGGFAFGIGIWGHRACNIKTKSLDVNGIYYLTPVLTVLWLIPFGLAQLERWDYFIIGTLIILATSIIIGVELEINRIGFRWLIVSLWSTGVLIYFREEWIQVPWLADGTAWEWGVESVDYYSLIVLSATIFILILSFRTSRLVERTTAEEDRYLKMKGSLSQLYSLIGETLKPHIIKGNPELMVREWQIEEDINDINKLLDKLDKSDIETINKRDQFFEIIKRIKNNYNQLRKNHEREIEPQNNSEEMSQKYWDLISNFDLLARSKLRGRYFAENLVLYTFALVTIMVTIGTRPTVHSPWNALLIDILAFLFSSAICFMTINLIDLRLYRKKSTLKLMKLESVESDDKKDEDDDDSVHFKYTKSPQQGDKKDDNDDNINQKAVQVVSIILAIVMAISFVVLLYDKWMGVWFI